jgi:hypothetical protein
MPLWQFERNSWRLPVLYSFDLVSQVCDTRIDATYLQGDFGSEGSPLVFDVDDVSNEKSRCRTHLCVLDRNEKVFVYI